MKKRYALVTVTSEDYLPGTLVLLQSFLQHNRWFSGDLVVLHDDLPEALHTYFQGWQQVQLVSVSTALKARIAPLVKVCSHLSRAEARFYALDVFRLEDYDRVLFCDSDLLFRGSVASLMYEPYAFQAAPDGPSYNGKGRDPLTFLPEKITSSSPTRLLYPCFNSGFFLVDRALLTQATLHDLYAHLEPRLWISVQTRHTDQVVLNRYFAGQVHLLSGRYNYLLKHRAALRARAGLALDEATVLHFTGRLKPWNTTRLAQALADRTIPLHAVQHWYRGYDQVKETLRQQGLSAPI